MNHFIKSLLTLIAILFVTNSFAQTGYEDVVYLKNGTIIHGMIVEQIPNQSVKIQTKDKNIFVFKMDEIEKITKEKTGSNSSGMETKVARPDDFTGYSLVIESYIGPGISGQSVNGMTLSGQAINGILIKGSGFIGAGVGFDINDLKNDNYFFLSKFFIDMRCSPGKKNISPLILLSTGYATDLSDGSFGGFLFNGGIGAKFKLQGKLAVHITANYKYQHLEGNSNYDIYNPSVYVNYNLQYIVFNVGVSF